MEIRKKNVKGLLNFIIIFYSFIVSNQVQPYTWCSVEHIKEHIFSKPAKFIYFCNEQSTKEDGLSYGTVFKGDVLF